MKKLILITFIFIGLFFSTCSILGESDSAGIVGQWEWYLSTGGFIGETITPDSAGVPDRHIIFTSNSEFYFFRADTLVVSGKYSISKNGDEPVISYDTKKENFFDQRMKFNGNDILILADECADCYINYYKRDTSN